MSDAYPAPGPERRGVLITRPEPGATETARQVAARGYLPILAPVLEIGPHRLRLPAGLPQAVLVTSGNAIPALPATLHAVMLLAIGDATAARARAAGFATVRSAGRDAAALAELTASCCRPQSGPLLLASGAGQGRELAAALRHKGFIVHRRIAYVAGEVAALPEPALIALRQQRICAALFFSPATAHVFVRLLRRSQDENQLRDVDAIAISAATQAALLPLPWRRIRVASTPRQDELIALMP